MTNIKCIEVDSSNPEYDAFRKYITENTEYQYVKFGQDYLVPNEAMILAIYQTGKEPTLKTLKGCAIISNYIPEHQTAEIVLFQVGESIRLFSRDVFIFVYDYLFRHMNLRKVNARVSQNNIPMRAVLEHQGWGLVINPLEYGPQEDEYHYYYFAEQWEAIRPIYDKGVH